MERRLQQRINNQQLKVEISDGSKSYDGIGYNLTYTGLAIEDLPRKFDLNTPTCILTIYGSKNTFKLRAVSRWSNTSNKCKSIGVRIYEVPRSWYQFVDSLNELQHTLRTL